MAERGGYRAALRSRDLRLMLGGFAVSAIGSWTYNVALWVWVWEATGSAAWVAAASVVRFLPALIFSTYGGVLAERFERTLVMRVCDTAAMVAMAVLAVATWLDGPVIVIIALAAATTAAGVANDPAVQAMVPQVVGERDLAAANALFHAIDNVAVIAGPAIGAGLLLFAPPSAAFAVNAATFGVAVLLVMRMTARSTPTDVAGDGEGVLAQMMVGVHALRGSTTATVLVGFSVLATFAYGVDTVLFMILAEERYGAGSNGVGYLMTGLGIGGVLAAGVVNRLAALPRLGVVISIGMAVYCLPTALLVVVEDWAVVVGLQVVRGAGTLVVDVLAITALQRSLAPDLLARVFGVFNTAALGALSVGALLAPLALAGLGIEASLLLFGLGIPALGLCSWPWLRRMDQRALARVAELGPRIEVLEGLNIFAAASRPVLERLAAAVTEQRVAAGDAVVCQGETADALYVVVDGEVSVQARGEDGEARHLATLRAPAYVGEIGLLERIPRTATVRATGPCRLWRIEGDAFIGALNDAPAAPAFLETARTRRVLARHVDDPGSEPPPPPRRGEP